MAVPTLPDVISTAQRNNAATSYTGVRPTTVAAGDLLICFMFLRSASAVTFSGQPDANWQLYGSATPTNTNASVYVWWKIASGSEATSLVWTGDVSTASRVVIDRVQGHDSTSPLHVGATTTDSTSPFDQAQVTTTVNDCLIYYFIAGPSASAVNYSAPLTDRDSGGSGTSTNTSSFCNASESWTTAGTTTLRQSTGSADTRVTRTVAVQPPLPPANPTGLTATVGTTSD